MADEQKKPRSYSPAVKKALGDMAENVQRHRNKAIHARQAKEAWKARAVAAERVLAQLKPFWDQCQRGESENPERYQDAYLMLDKALREYMEVRAIR